MTSSKRKLISGGELARMAGVSRAAISQACQKGRPLEAARVGKGQSARIDLNHPAVQRYLAQRERKAKAAEKAAQPPKPRGGAAVKARAKAEAPPVDIEAAPDIPENISAVADWSLRDVIDRFGTETAFGDWLKALKTIEDVDEKRLKNMERRGLVVSRALVETHVFGVIEATNQRLLHDSPKTIAGQIRAAIKTGATNEKLEELVREIIGGQLRTVKARAVRALREAANDTAEQATPE